MSSPLPPALLEAPLLLDLVPPVQPTSSMTKRPLLPPPLLFLLLATLAVAIALIVGVVCLGGRWVSSSIGVALVGGWDGSADVASSDAIPPHFLPDPFTFLNGSSVTTRAQWLQRREEIGELLQRFELGPKMPRPAQLTGSVTSTAITVRAGHGNASITFTSQVTLPTTGKAPYPAMIGLGSISLNVTRLLELGVAIIMFNNSDIAEQNGPQSRGQGKFYTLYPNNPAGALMAWAWAVSTLIDVLEESGRDMFDVRRLGVTGCSRNGKGSLVVGAFDERIALSIPQESGSGGAASWRMSDWQNDQDTPPGGKQAVQTLGEIVWFRESFVEFSNSSDRLPYDHHMLEGMVAPRGLLIYENPSTYWGGNQSCWGDSLAGHTIYEALGASDHMGISQLGGYSHCFFPASQASAVDAFVTRFLLGARVNTSIITTDAKTYSFNSSMWINWTVPFFD